MNQSIQLIADHSDLLIFFDDDIRLDSQILIHYNLFANQFGKNTFFGGPISTEYETPPEKWLDPYLPPSAKGWKAPEENSSEFAKQTFLGFNWACFAGDFQKAGCFNETIGPGKATLCGGQESELQSRLIARGVRKIYIPNAQVWHFVPRNRCSAQWALSRAYREGIRRQLFSNSKNSQSLTLWWILKAIILMRYALFEWLQNKTDSRSKRHFDAKYQFRLLSGRLRAKLGFFLGISTHQKQIRP